MRVLIFLFLALSLSFAQLRVVATYPWIGDLVKRIGKDRVDVFILAKPTEDPHFVVPKPSFIARLRSADLLVIQGASLEVGFVPVLLQQSNNPKIQPGREGFLDLSGFVRLIEKPQSVSRAMGDVHPEGNPHYNLDPHNIPILARAIKEKLCSLDRSGCASYEENLRVFEREWSDRLREWDRRLSVLRGQKVVSYHMLYDYLLLRYGAQLVGTIEPLPGIPPTPRHTQELVGLVRSQGVRLILQDVYHEKRTAQYIASQTGARVVELPHDGYNLVELFNTISIKLEEALR
ncbi:metal ABC transporter solute-binding protein, Zn/Mn family [Thermocrinis minervae]|uniref:Zinc/manganese transport system substrate-binding protein n=1 Tax=Thermocrinis minervae TaxID=381751 RepID=A0A1M6QQG6_9AQUI|nr:zinc ABC transporter substrate-binding protein [Thermocrinis minervae]SHK22340.1 zinc/manganese transport system substrate-binding protein [Thermocrinis minervae]